MVFALEGNEIAENQFIIICSVPDRGEVFENVVFEFIKSKERSIELSTANSKHCEGDFELGFAPQDCISGALSIHGRS